MHLSCVFIHKASLFCYFKFLLQICPSRPIWRAGQLNLASQLSQPDKPEISHMKKVSGYNIHQNTLCHDESVSEAAHPAYIPRHRDGGLSELQKSTSDVLASTPWGFSNSKLKVKRHKLDNHTWQLTVVNPKTSKTILQVEGHGDMVFAHEDNLARMAETLMEQGLTIRTQFDE